MRWRMGEPRAAAAVRGSGGRGKRPEMGVSDLGVVVTACEPATVAPVATLPPPYGRMLTMIRMMGVQFCGSTPIGSVLAQAP